MYVFNHMNPHIIFTIKLKYTSRENQSVNSFVAIYRTNKLFDISSFKIDTL